MGIAFALIINGPKYIFLILIFFLEITQLLHQSNCLEAEMVHFIHQMQYYITFEVLNSYIITYLMPLVSVIPY